MGTIKGFKQLCQHGFWRRCQRRVCGQVPGLEAGPQELVHHLQALGRSVGDRCGEDWRPGSDYGQFVENLPKDDCRYAVYDFEYDQPDCGGKRSKILFVLWSPDTAKIKSKMLYTSSKDGLRKKLVGIGTEIQATDSSEIDFETVLDKVTRGGTTA